MAAEVEAPSHLSSAELTARCHNAQAIAKAPCRDRGSMSVFAAISQKLSLHKLDPDVEAKLRIEQYFLVCSSMQSTSFGIPLLAALVCFILSEWVEVLWLAAWWSAVLTVSMCNYAIDVWQKRSLIDVSTIARWINVRCALAFVFNVIWTLPAFIFWPYCQEVGQLFLILIYACSLSAGVALAAPSPRWAFALATPLAMALVIPPLFSGTWFYQIISLLSLGFIAFMVQLAFTLFLSARNSLLLRDQNTDLIAQLSRAKAKSDDACSRAEAASRAKSEFLANMSHELRTPLNAVLGFSEMIKTRVWGDTAIARYVDYAESIHTSGQYLLHLINDILDLAKIEAGKFELQENRVELTTVAREAVALLEMQAKNKGVRTVVDATQNVWLTGDERALRQVLANLLSNAVKFTLEGGTITVVVVRTHAQGASVTVRDTGVGIRPADLTRVMEHFGQGRHDLAATKERGTGLGLPIVRGLIEAHGGEIRIESELGVGTAVSVILPECRIESDLGETAARKTA